MIIDETTHKNAVNDVKNGMPYSQVAKKYGVNDTAVRRWCRDAGVQSFHASRRKTDKEILDAVKLHKVGTCHTLANILGCSTPSLNRHLRIMVVSGKIQSFRIPPFNSAARRRGLFTKFINMRIYYVSKNDLAEWVRNQFPEDVPESLRRVVSGIFRSIDVKIFESVKK